MNANFPSLSLPKPVEVTHFQDLNAFNAWADREIQAQIIEDVERAESSLPFEQTPFAKALTPQSNLRHQPAPTDQTTETTQFDPAQVAQFESLLSAAKHSSLRHQPLTAAELLAATEQDLPDTRDHIPGLIKVLRYGTEPAQIRSFAIAQTLANEINPPVSEIELFLQELQILLQATEASYSWQDVADWFAVVFKESARYRMKTIRMHLVAGLDALIDE